MSTPRTARVHAVDWIKAAAILAVIATHSGFDFFRDDVTRWDVVLRQSWTSFHVPAFLIVSGYLYRRTAAVDLAHVGARLWRILPPYFVATVFVQAIGYADVQDLGDVAFQLVTGSAVGIYYYVVLLTLCTLLVWPLSRMSSATVLTLLGVFTAYSVAAGFLPGLHTTEAWFWSVRNPLEFYYLGYFLAGWSAAAYAPQLATAFLAARATSWVAILLGISGGIALNLWSGIGTLSLDERVAIIAIYTFCAVGGIAALTATRPPPAFVRLLSEATFTLYLYHRLLQQALLPQTAGWPPALRIAVLFSVGLAGGALVWWLGRRLLGERWSRRLLGT